jgi:cytochrome P450
VTGLVTAERAGRWISLGRYLRDPAAYMLAVGTGKDLVHFRLGPRDFWLVNHPDLIERVLTRPDGLIRDRVFREARRFIGQGHTTMDGEPHRKRRALVEPALHPDEIKAYGQRIVKRAATCSESWNDGAVVDVNLEMLELMLWVLTDVLLDADLEEDAPEVAEAVAATLKVVHRLFMPGAGALWKLPLPATRRFDDAIGRSDALIYGMIRERRAASGQRSDVLSALIRAGGGNGQPLDDRQVRDELVTLLFGGRGDLAQATTWAWHLLSAHPHVERRWHDEIDGLLGGSAPTADDLPRLPYTRALFWEVLRLYPPGWVFVREVAMDYELGDFVIRPGASIMISPLVTHRDPRYWADPLRFEPDRWLEGGAGPQRPCTDLAFGGGDRACVGRHLAAMVGPLVLATIGQRWRPRAVPGERVQEIGRFNLEPKGGLRMRLERRRTT